MPRRISLSTARCPSLAALVLAAAAIFAAPPAAAQESLEERLERIQRLLYEANIAVDSLRREIGRASGPADTARPILGELASERQRRLARATRSTLRTSAAGYSFNPDYPFGMSATHWMEPWGARLGTYVDWGSSPGAARTFGIEASALRSLHRFTGFELLETHLFGFAGVSVFRSEFYEYAFPSTGWYDVPDVSGSLQAGVGTEISVPFVGGIRLVPEVGWRATRFFSRHQESPGYPGTLPESDFSLDPHFALHVNFYFR